MTKKGKLIFGIAVAAAWIVVLTLAAIFLFPRLKDWLPGKPASPEEVLNIAMEAVTGNGTEDPVFLGADGTPVGVAAPKGIAAVISSKVSYSLVSMEVSDDIATATIEIVAPDTLALVRESLSGMDSYDAALFLERMERLLEKEFENVTNTVQLEMHLIGNQWCVVTNAEFSDAITGGLISRYAELQEAIKEALAKEGTQ